MTADINKRIDELEHRVAVLKDACERTAELVEKLANINNDMVDVICFMSGIEPKDFIFSRDTERKGS